MILSRRHFAQMILGAFATIPFLTRFLPSASGFDREAVLAAVEMYPPVQIHNQAGTCTRAIVLAYIEDYGRKWHLVVASSAFWITDLEYALNLLPTTALTAFQEVNVRGACADFCHDACHRGYWDIGPFMDGGAITRLSFRRFRLVPR